MDVTELTKGEVELLINGSSDEVAFNWTVIRLDIFQNPRLRPGPPSDTEIERAFQSLERLVEGGYIVLGRMEYIDGGPPGRLAPTHVISEPIGLVKERVKNACAEARKHDPTGIEWAFSCWLTCTESGCAVANEALKPENRNMRRWFLDDSGWTRTPD